MVYFSKMYKSSGDVIFLEEMLSTFVQDSKPLNLEKLDEKSGQNKISQDIAVNSCFS